MTPKWLTIGIEEEYQIVDNSGELRPHISTLLAQHGQDLGDAVRAEMIQSVVEVGTGICETVEQAREELTGLRAKLADLLRPDNLRIACAGTHPFSKWQEQLITDKDRYKMLEDEMQDVVRSILIFGLHVHVAIPDRDRGTEIMNEARYFLPHLLALSVSSPFWAGRDTGLKSYRSVVWSRFPRTGIPPHFVSYDEYENYLEMLVRTGCIDDGKKIWWDLRSHPYHPTLEFRCCDQTTRIEETLCLAALTQAICAKLIRLRERNLGSRKAVEHVHTILREGTSADRQLQVHRDTGDLSRVVDHLNEETMAGTGA